MAYIRRMLKKPLNQPRQNTKSSYCCVVNKMKQASRLDWRYWRQCPVCRDQHARDEAFFFFYSYMTSLAPQLQPYWKSGSTKTVINVDCKHRVLCWSLRTKGSLCFRVALTFSGLGGRHLSLLRQTQQPLQQELQHSGGLLKGILGNTEKHDLMYERVERAHRKSWHQIKTMLRQWIYPLRCNCTIKK